MSKSTVKAARRSATLVALINGAASLGYAFSGGFEAACASAKKLVPSTYLNLSDEQRKAYASQIADFGRHFKAGHLLRYLEQRGYQRRFGNLDEQQKITECLAIFDKARPDNLEKTDRRTALEHLGCRTADNAWSRVKDAAGLKPPAPKRAPAKRRAAGDEKAVPSARLTIPRMHAPVDALGFFTNASNDLFRAVNANAAVVPIGLKSAVQAFRKAVREAVADVKANAPAKPAKRAPRKAAAPAAVVAAAAPQGNGAGAPA
jgi:hypothetical protein